MEKQPSSRCWEFAVVGLGQTGLSCARFLRGAGRSFVLVDTRKNPPELAALRASFPEVPLILGEINPELLQRVQTVLISPGLSPNEPVIAALRAAGKTIHGDIELFCRHARSPIAAVTGTNGKSTVSALLGEMARQADMDVRVGGNFGVPALDILAPPAPALYVLELSSFQLETVASLNAAVAAVLNVTEDHLDRHATLDEYAAIKERIYTGTGVVVINLDDPRVVAMTRKNRSTLSFSTTSNNADVHLKTVRGVVHFSLCGRSLLPVSLFQLAGKHNEANALAAIAMASALRISDEAIQRGLSTFSGLPHRCQMIGKWHGVAWYNDSKSTNVGATLAAVSGLTSGERKLVLLVGGLGKGGDFAPLKAIAKHLKALITFGEDGALIARTMQGHTDVRCVANLSDAIRQASDLAEAGDAVLFSPACASFDMFANYQVRGECFVTESKQLLEKGYCGEKR